MQQPREGDPRADVGGLGGDAARSDVLVAGGDQPVGLGGHQPVEERLDGRRRLKARRTRPRPRRRGSPSRAGCSSPGMAWASAGLESMSTLASSTAPARRSTAASSTGVSWRQGPHQAAQKSTTTGISRERSITSTLERGLGHIHLRHPPSRRRRRSTVAKPPRRSRIAQAARARAAPVGGSAGRAASAPTGSATGPWTTWRTPGSPRWGASGAVRPVVAAPAARAQMGHAAGVGGPGRPSKSSSCPLLRGVARPRRVASSHRPSSSTIARAETERRGLPTPRLRWGTWPTSTSSPCTASGGCILPTRWCSTTSRCRSCPGAKIGVLGANGAGKSTLLRDHGRAGPRDFSGRRRAGARRHGGHAAPGARPRRVPGRPGQHRAGRRRDGGLLRRFEEIGARLGEVDPDEMEALLVEYSEVQDEIERRNAWDLERTLEVAMDALRVAAGRPGRDDPVGGRAPARRPVPPAALGARSAAPGRAHQPPRRRVGGVAGTAPGGVRRHGRRRDPRPLLPRQRGRLDPRARPRARHPLEGQLLVVARAEAQPAGAGGEGRVRRARRPSAASSSGCAARRARARPRARRASPSYERLLAEEGERRAGAVEIRIPAPPRLGDLVLEVRRPHQGLRRPAADGGPVVHAPARRHRGRHRRQRRGQDHPLPDDRGRGEAGRRAAAAGRDRRSSPTSTSRARRSTPRTPCGRRSRAART